MGINLSAVVSFILLLLSLFFFVLPAVLGASVLIFSVLVSFTLLIIALFTAVHGLNYKGNLSGLAMFSFICSTVFFLFLIMSFISHA